MQQESSQKYRLVTRSNFDGIASAALLKKADMVDEMRFVHPHDIQSGEIEITKRDIVTNLPYVDSAYMAFDHRLESDEGVRLNPWHALYTDAGSVTEVIYHYYGGEARFGTEMRPLIDAANRSKNAGFMPEEIENPRGWDLLIFLTDPRTGLGRFHDFRISNYALMQKLPDLMRTHTIDEILEDPDVRERAEMYSAYQDRFVMQLQRCTVSYGDIAVVDLSEEPLIYPGNRFMLYACYPEIAASIHIFPAKSPDKTVIALGNTIFGETQGRRIDEIVTRYGGGGHADAGTCQVPTVDRHRVTDEIISLLKKEA